MRRFRLIKYDEAYEPLDLGKVYDGDFLPNNWSETIEETAKRFPNEWEEVFDESKPLHKDTDLGYFAGVFAASGCDISDSVNKAKRLIKQLDKEVSGE